ncbi:hypothetical protein [Thiosulfativibrio zosterae]|uniref:Uncharacterized protein n=1 Tax=Thiosulfativibrio zosterae TaxID=2675053 RepID=A0A6F8PPY2_9GAMM|nr:hypothetical protein [Thiosulfativibrio zosterae]BBP44050.1 hypothetical protein THMIRHAT_17960 [Thiosulfativibrio zosterae]
MSCCSNGYCQFSFPVGAPLTDHPVVTLEAKYLFLPYGTLLAQGELIRIWTESGKTKEVIIEHKIFLDYAKGKPLPVESLPENVYLPWQLIAMDSGWEQDAIMEWGRNEVANPDSPPVVLIFNQPLEPKLTWKERWYRLLYKIRTL